MCGIAAVLLILIWFERSWWEDVIVYRSLSLLFVALASAPWLRFSLRTLLLVISLIAVVLAVGVYLDKSFPATRY
jgi:hypothetical protein